MKPKKGCFFRSPFLRVLGILGGPRHWKSSQNAVKVCKNGGLPFPQENYTSCKKHQKTTPSGTPKTEGKLKNLVLTTL